MLKENGRCRLLMGVLIMPYMGSVASDQKQTGRADRKGFIRRYPVFGLMAAGITFAFVFHNMVCTYLINVMEAVMSMTDSFGMVAGSLPGGLLLSGGGTGLMLTAGTAMAAAGMIITFIAAKAVRTEGIKHERKEKSNSDGRFHRHGQRHSSGPR